MSILLFHLLGGAIYTSISFPIIYWIFRWIKKKKLNRIKIFKAFIISWILTSFSDVILSFVVSGKIIINKSTANNMHPILATAIVIYYYFRKSKGKNKEELSNVPSEKTGKEKVSDNN